MTRICKAAQKPRLMIGAFAAPLIIEFVMFAMTAIKAWKHYRLLGSAGDQNTTLYVTHRDGARFYAVMIVAQILNVWIVSPSSIEPCFELSSLKRHSSAPCRSIIL